MQHKKGYCEIIAHIGLYLHDKGRGYCGLFHLLAEISAAGHRQDGHLAQHNNYIQAIRTSFYDQVL